MCLRRAVCLKDWTSITKIPGIGCYLAVSTSASVCVEEYDVARCGTLDARVVRERCKRMRPSRGFEARGYVQDEEYEAGCYYSSSKCLDFQGRAMFWLGPVLIVNWIYCWIGAPDEI